MWNTRRVLLALAAGGAVGAVHAAPQAFVIDAANTHVHWELKHFGTSTARGRFDAISGSITLDREAHSGGASFTISTASISTGSALFDGVLRGRYLLSTEDEPNAYFVSRRFGFDGDQLTNVSGDFTLRGVSQSLTLRALRFSCRMDTDPAREVCGGDFETEFNRSAFGITHSLPFVADRVRVLIQIEAVRQ
ncbi:MAG: YceI family protein [Burkholderiales bacterium]